MNTSANTFLWYESGQPDSHYAQYDTENNIDRFIFKQGDKVNKNMSKLIFFTKAKIKPFERYDIIHNSSGSPIINEKIEKILLEICPNQVQFFNTAIHCNDGISQKYKLVNITKTAKCIDHKHSICDRMTDDGSMCKTGGHIIGFYTLKHLPSCLGNLIIARDEERHSNIVVSSILIESFIKAKVKGVKFLLPEQAYNDTPPDELI